MTIDCVGVQSHFNSAFWSFISAISQYISAKPDSIIASLNQSPDSVLPNWASRHRLRLEVFYLLRGGHGCYDDAINRSRLDGAISSLGD